MPRFKLHLFGSTPNSSVPAVASSTSSEPAMPAHVAPDGPADEAAAPASPARSPQGKLGQVLARLASPSGATIEELAEETGWQPHTLRAAMSRLRRKGYRIERTAEAGGGRAYRLVASEG